MKNVVLFVISYFSFIQSIVFPKVDWSRSESSAWIWFRSHHDWVQPNKFQPVMWPYPVNNFPPYHYKPPLPPPSIQYPTKPDINPIKPEIKPIKPSTSKPVIKPEIIISQKPTLKPILEQPLNNFICNNISHVHEINFETIPETSPIPESDVSLQEIYSSPIPQPEPEPIPEISITQNPVVTPENKPGTTPTIPENEFDNILEEIQVNSTVMPPSVLKPSMKPIAQPLCECGCPYVSEPEFLHSLQDENIIGNSHRILNDTEESTQETSENYIETSEKYEQTSEDHTSDNYDQVTENSDLKSEDSNRIVGGDPARRHQYPWLALLVLQPFATAQALPWCTGAIISPFYVLTAAHCIAGNVKLSDVKVLLGVHDRCGSENSTVSVSVHAAHIPPGFEPKLLVNDIAILRLSMPLNFGPQISPICMPRKGVTYWGQNGEVAGWGKTLHSTENQGSCVLLRATLPILSRASCAESKYKLKKITSSHFCAGFLDQAGPDTCQGDSGGPLVVSRLSDGRYEVVGVVSGGQGCAQPGYPGLYTSVVKFLPWIIAVTADAPFCVRP